MFGYNISYVASYVKLVRYDISLSWQLHDISVLVFAAVSTYVSRLTIVSHEAKKKQAIHDEQVSYLHVAPL